MRAIRFEDVAHRPAPGMGVPKLVRFSPDGAYLSFLQPEPGGLRQDLVLVDVASGERRILPAPGAEVDEAGLSLEEQLRRERSRDLGVGVTSYAWASDAPVLLVPLADGLWVGGPDGMDTLAVSRNDTQGPILDPVVSSDGGALAYVCDDEVYVAPVGGSTVQVTAGARGTGRTNGVAEFIAQEEMGRSRGFWLNQAATRVAFCEVDETNIPAFRIMHLGSDEVGDEAQEDHRYPFAGAANATVRLGVVPADGSGRDAPVWLDLGTSGIGEDRYLARVDWQDDDHLLVQIQDRSQTRLDLVRFDVTTGTGTLVLSEECHPWVGLHDDLRPRTDGSFLWSTERTGHRHLELRDANGSLIRTLTAGDWVVTGGERMVRSGVVATDPEHVWFTATIDSPLDRTLCRVPFDGGPIERITDTPGVHVPVVHPASGAWADLVQGLTGPPRLVLHRPNGSETVVADGSDDVTVQELDLPEPELRTIPAADGTPLHVALYRPAGPGPFPTIVSLYGGPHVQLVTRSWSLRANLQRQLLREQGFLVAVVDNRGSANRGLGFEQHLHRRMGTVEVDDQVALVEHLATDGLTDPERVGVIGWSYGGYLSAMCLARRPDVFRAACAGAPTTSWDGYDTHYTERYMGTPADNPDGYRDGAVMTHVEGLRDRSLLLIHGLIDENVHFRHTARLVNALVHADIEHELLLYPDERHAPRHEADRVSMEHRILRFFRNAL